MAISYVHTISAEDYHALRTIAGWDCSLRQMQAGIDGSAYIVAAIDRGKCIGAARLVSDGGFYGIIADVVVRPEYRGAGVGKALVQSIADYIKSTLEPGETYRVNLMAAKGKEGFYEKLGFTRRPSEEFGHGMAMQIKG